MASVIGIDFGNHSCSVGRASVGGLDVLSNEFCHRSTPTVLSMPPSATGRRDVGEQAENHLITQPKSTAMCFKRQMNTVNPGTNSTIELVHRGADRPFAKEQLCAMMLGKMADLGSPTATPCAISVPCYATDADRRSVTDAARIAGIQDVQLINDTSAVALTYGLSKQDIEENRKVVFLDFGHSALQASVCQFGSDGFHVLSQAATVEVGGRIFDERLAEHLGKVFKEQTKVLVQNGRVKRKLLKEAEQLKKQMSANRQMLPVRIECLAEDRDLSTSISRQDFENMSQDLFDHIRAFLRSFTSELDLSSIHSVELTGGSSRIPAFRSIVQEIFSQEPVSTVSVDEAVVRGCTMQAALSSQYLKTKQYSAHGTLLNPIQVKYTEGEETKTKVLFDKQNLLGSSCRITLPSTSTIAVEYSSVVDATNSFIAMYQLDVPAESQNIHLDFTLDVNGLLKLNSVSREVDGAAIAFTETMLGGLTREKMEEFIAAEIEFRKEDQLETQRQESKNRLEEKTFSVKEQLSECPQGIQKEETWAIMKQHVQDVLEWLDEADEAATEEFEAKHTELDQKMHVFHLWMKKFNEKEIRQKQRVIPIEIEQEQAPSCKRRQGFQDYFPFHHMDFPSSHQRIPQYQSPFRRPYDSPFYYI